MLMRVVDPAGPAHSARRRRKSAVQFEGDTAFVYQVVAQGRQGTIAQRADGRDAASTEGGFVEILDGLKAGDRVVADGLNRIQPNAPVSVGRPGARAGRRPAAAAPRRPRGQGAAP